MFYPLKVTYYATRCECDYPLQAIIRKSASSAIPSGRIHLEVCWIDQPTQWTVANVAHLSVIHLGGHAPYDVRRGRFSKRPVTANHTYTGGMMFHFYAPCLLPASFFVFFQVFPNNFCWSLTFGLTTDGRELLLRAGSGPGAGDRRAVLPARPAGHSGRPVVQRRPGARDRTLRPHAQHTRPALFPWGPGQHPTRCLHMHAHAHAHTHAHTHTHTHTHTQTLLNRKGLTWDFQSASAALPQYQTRCLSSQGFTVRGFYAVVRPWVANTEPPRTVEIKQECDKKDSFAVTHVDFSPPPPFPPHLPPPTH